MMEENNREGDLGLARDVVQKRNACVRACVRKHVIVSTCMCMHM